MERYKYIVSTHTKYSGVFSLAWPEWDVFIPEYRLVREVNISN